MPEYDPLRFSIPDEMSPSQVADQFADASQPLTPSASPAEARRLIAASDAFMQRIVELSDGEPTRCKEVYAALVESPRPEARHMAACVLDHLTRIDPLGSIPLWQQIFQDEDPITVRLGLETFLDGVAAKDLLSMSQAEPILRNIIEYPS